MRKHYFALTILLLASFVLLFSGCQDPVNTPVETPAVTPETPQVTNYTVTFNANDSAATGNTASITAQANSTITLTQNGFTLQGFAFTGWNTAADGSGTSYADRASLQLTGNLTLYAQWEQIIYYTVTFIANHSSATGNTTSITEQENSTITLTQNGFTLEGFTFTGWNTAADGSGTGYADCASLQLTGNLTLYAQWVSNAVPTYTISITPVENGTITASQTIAEARTVITITITTDEFYLLDTFIVTDTENKTIITTVNQNNNTFSFTMPEKDVIVSATLKYTIHSINISSVQNGTVVVNKTIAETGTEITVTITPDEFYLLDTLTVTDAENKTIITTANQNNNTYSFTMPEKDVIVSATFKLKTYTITFKANNNTATGSMDRIKTLAGSTIILPQNNFKRSGYSLRCWNTAPDGSGTDYTDNGILEVTKNITLYAQWILSFTSNTITETFQSLTSSCMIKGEGTFDNNSIRKINAALKEVAKKGILVALDLSSAKISSLENAGSERENASFYKCINLTMIILPNTLTTIGQYAFYRCINLETIEIPNSVVEIKDYAFNECRFTSIMIPDSVTSIGSNVFKECINLTDIELPNSLINIWDHAFDGCTALSTIEIPGSVNQIGEYAFEGCSSLSNIILHDGIRIISSGAFSHCKSLSNIIIPDSVTVLGLYVFWECSNLKSIKISNHVRLIPPYAFFGCVSLPYIEIPATVISIGSHAFDCCGRLTSINMSNSITSIGEYAFNNCNITSINMPNSVTSIGTWAFNNCKNLTSINIPSSVTSIGTHVFDNCNNLSNILFQDTTNSWFVINTTNEEETEIGPLSSTDSQYNTTILKKYNCYRLEKKLNNEEMNYE